MTEHHHMKTKKRKFSCKKFFLLAGGALLISLIPDISFASVTFSFPSCYNTGGDITISLDGTCGAGSIGLSDGGIGFALCRVVSWFSGPIGSAIASLAVIFLGISAFFGKVNWGMALLFAAGIFAIFSAGTIVHSITGELPSC